MYTAVRTAMPRAPPNSRIVLFTPDARLCSCSATEPMTVAGFAAKTRPMPTPARTIAPTICPYARPGFEISANHTSATAWSRHPAAWSGPPPTRPTSALASGTITIGAAVHGSVRRPASNGE